VIRTAGTPWRSPLLAALVTLGAPHRAAPQQMVPAPSAPAPRAWSAYTGLSNVYDSNIDHTPLGLESYGVLVVVGGHYRNRFPDGTLDLWYDGVFRRYTNTTLWNRPAHNAGLSIDQRTGPHWEVGATAQVELNGSAEDRVLRNEYSMQPQLEYRFTRSTRLQLYGDYLLKRYPVPLGQNAVDPRVGLRFRQLLGAHGSFGMSGRYEYNYADSTRYRYTGWTGGLDIASPLWPGARIASSARYRTRRYTSRLVDLGTTDVLRRDEDRVAILVWQQTLLRVWELNVSYRYENYGSNDTRKEFQEHLVGLTIKRLW
jgi:hypothetical protein